MQCSDAHYVEDEEDSEEIGAATRRKENSGEKGFEDEEVKDIEEEQDVEEIF